MVFGETLIPTQIFLVKLWPDWISQGRFLRSITGMLGPGVQGCAGKCQISSKIAKKNQFFRFFSKMRWLVPIFYFLDRFGGWFDSVRRKSRPLTNFFSGVMAKLKFWGLVLKSFNGGPCVWSSGCGRQWLWKSQFFRFFSKNFKSSKKS